MNITQILRPTAADRALAQSITALPATRSSAAMVLPTMHEGAPEGGSHLDLPTTASVPQARAAWRWALRPAAQAN